MTQKLSGERTCIQEKGQKGKNLEYFATLQKRIRKGCEALKHCFFFLQLSVFSFKIFLAERSQV